MAQPIPTYALYGLDAIPAEIIVERERVRVVERQSHRTLHEVKREPIVRTPASVQSDGLTLVRRKPAPETRTTSWTHRSCPIVSQLTSATGFRLRWDRHSLVS